MLFQVAPLRIKNIMLDQTTKRKLDSARQILVGKVPDPKAQVERALNGQLSGV